MDRLTGPITNNPAVFYTDVFGNPGGSIRQEVSQTIARSASA